jgi:uncharacterized protein (DUF433 family)
MPEMSSVLVYLSDSPHLESSMLTLPDFLVAESDGFIHLVGHRIGLVHLVNRYNDGYSPEMLQGEFPTLPLPLIHKTIAFYLENQPEVDTLASAESSAIATQAATGRIGPDLAELRRRLSNIQKVESP